MSTPNNAVNNQTGTAGTTAFHNHLRSASGQWHRYNDTTDTHGYYSGVGSPEGVVAADIGSIYTDTGAGASGVYYKTSDVANTGWELIPLAGADEAFLAYLGAGDPNVTGGGTYYLLGTNTGLTEDFDTGGNFTPGPVAGGAFYTVPSTGVYHFSASIGLENVTAAMTRGQISLDINGTTTAYLLMSGNTASFRGNLNGETFAGSMTLSLTAGDLVRFAVQLFNDANTADLAGPAGAFRQCTVSGFKVSSGTPINGQLSVVNQTFTANGTYTPTAGMVYCEIECQAGGGGGGGAANSIATIAQNGAGGGGGEYARILASAATIGVSQAVTVGAAGTAGTIAGTNGGAGGGSSVGVICVANGGGGGQGNTGAGSTQGATGGTGGTGTLLIQGEGGDNGPFSVSASVALSGGKGGGSFFGEPAAVTAVNGSALPGAPGQFWGSGGAGGHSFNATGGAQGGQGAQGIVVITEYVVV